MNNTVTRSASGSREGDTALAAKVLFLAQPASYPEPTLRVDTVETHMSWVFLTDRHAWKLKKPVRQSYLDFSTEAARRHLLRRGAAAQPPPRAATSISASCR